MATYIAHVNYGVWSKNVRVHVDRRLKEHKSAQCGVSFQRGITYFYSYSTLAATIDNEGFLCIHCVFSRTTLTQIQWFIREYCPHVGHLAFDEIKRMYENREHLNIYTGEIKIIPFVSDNK